MPSQSVRISNNYFKFLQSNSLIKNFKNWNNFKSKFLKKCKHFVKASPNKKIQDVVIKFGFWAKTLIISCVRTQLGNFDLRENDLRLQKLTLIEAPL